MVVGFSSMSPLVQALVVVVVTTVVVQLIRWLLAYCSYFKFFNKLPGETDFSWIWGNMHKPEILDYLQSLNTKYPRFYRLWRGPFNVSVSLNHPDTVRQLLKTSDPKPFSYNYALPWLGEGLLIASGNKWARSRRLLTPAFHFDILKPYVAVSNAACDVMLQKLQKHAETKTSIEMFGVISLCTFDVILQCAMSYKDDIQQKGESHPYVLAVTEITELWTERARNPLMTRDVIYSLTKNGRRFRQQCDFVHAIAENVIKTRKESLERDGPPQKRYLDFLDILLTAKDDNGQGMTSLDIRNEVDTFMFEGHDTTASAIAWALYSLCEHPKYQQRVQAEVDHILQGRDSDNIEWSDLSKLEFLTMVIKESMRLHCPVPLIGREITQPLSLDGVTIPAGTSCTINIINVHHNPTVWPDPYSFKPERFHPDNMKDKDSYAFIPFSAGPRNCIGQHFAMNEQKVILSRMLRRFTFTLDPNHPVTKKTAAVMRTMTGMRMIATPRTPTV
ncbi:hypothetical protein BaRGS_00014168 [Batillaria attramentaria]|uniref:Cytochrome P450 n=1 Tax=Batillaria attramentaria TaxID=370345 RepID=A0ABD0L5S5_9CAEN